MRPEHPFNLKRIDFIRPNIDEHFQSTRHPHAATLVNASKIVLTANKGDARMIHRYSGYPGGLTVTKGDSLFPRKTV